MKKKTLNPASSTLHGILVQAVQHHQAGRLDKAQSLYERVLKSSPNHPDALHLLGLVAHQRGNHDRARSLIVKAISFSPGNPAFHNNLGNVQLALLQPEEACRSFRKAVTLKSDYAEAHNNLGNALQKLGQLNDAVDAYAHALNARPGYAEAHCNLGTALRKLGRLEEARDCYETAISFKPDYATAYSNLGLVYHDQARYEEALPFYDKALSINPELADAHANRAVLLLLLGRFGEGWSEYEWRWKVDGFTTEPRDLGRPMWDGSDLGGKTILLHAEQGMGSAIQFIRYAPLVAARNGQVVLECQRPLFGLFSAMTQTAGSAVSRVVIRGESLPAFDTHAPLMSLPRILGTTLDSIPGDVPYLFADKAAVGTWRSRLAGGRGPRIGLVWAGNPRHANDHNRSMPASSLMPLLQSATARFFSLQKGAAARDVDLFPAETVANLGAEISDFADTAAIISNLDLVISVDTAAAHLAGALGRQVWMLIPHVPEWRWLLDRDDTPWYPTMRLFRQSTPGDWELLINRVVEALPEVSLQK